MEMQNQGIFTHNADGMVFFQLIGGVKIFHGENRRAIRLTRVTQSLLIYLLLERGRLHNRDVLANLFWGDQNMHHARNCLSTTLWRLRIAFKKEGIQTDDYIISSESGEIGFMPRADYWLDVARFDESISRALRRPLRETTTADAQSLEACLDENSGELLEGMYEDWALRAREQKHLLYLDGLAYLLHYYQLHDQLERGLEIGQKILDRDPLREDIHREMIYMYTRLGRRSLAMRQYETCRRLLAEELGIAPMPETETAMQFIANLPTEILAKADGQEANEHLPTNLEQAIQQLRRANKNFLAASEQVQKAITFLEKYSETHSNKLLLSETKSLSSSSISRGR